MKYLITIIIVFFLFISCKAQSPILPLDDNNDFVNGAYYKDINNELNKFEGTWIYTNGNTVFTIELKKVEQTYNGDWYDDILIGEYKYVENGVELVNYLPRLNNPLVNNAQHYIDGNEILKKYSKPKCESCDVNERRIGLYFSDPERNYLDNYFSIRYINDSGIEKIEAKLTSGGTYVTPYENAPRDPRVPYGDYTLIKQN